MINRWIWVLIGTILIVSDVSACLFIGPEKMVILFPPNIQIHSLLVREFCTPESCKVDGEAILYQSAYDPTAGVFINEVPPAESKVKLSTLSISLPKNHKAPGTFVWAAAMSVELKRLVGIGALTEVSPKDISAIERIVESSAGEYNELFSPQLYYKPEGCGNSYYLPGAGDDDSDSPSGWQSMGGNCLIESYAKNCPKIGCYRCNGGDFITSVPGVRLEFTRQNSAPKNK